MTWQECFLLGVAGGLFFSLLVLLWFVALGRLG